MFDIFQGLANENHSNCQSILGTPSSDNGNRALGVIGGGTIEPKRWISMQNYLPKASAGGASVKRGGYSLRVGPVIYDLDLVSLEFGVALMAGYSLLVIIVAVVVPLRRY